ncbi:hypothetical protein [uncultured Erythrobacter sp.]|uniref:hypothetical protein n=1 Tax=uncultured Erythrobacter sp. TaxID=263913 RepID=UPI00260D235D|nr:hypothetical protein [uncultured Erythrobacter sp.]
MRLSQYIDRQPVKRKKSRAKPASGLQAIAAQRFFVPIISAWGAALLGLIVMVLPADAIIRITVLTKSSFLGDWAQLAYAGIAAVLGGGIAYFAAGSMHERARASDESLSVVSAVQSRRSGRVDPIDPATDLGSDSLDAPIEEGEFEELREDCAASGEKRAPTLGELSKRGYEMEAPEDVTARENGGDALFTRKHFQSALIETCEAETCEAETCEAVADQNPEKEDDMAQVLTKPKRDGGPAPIGSPRAATEAASWSLTQFTPPSPEAAPAPVPAPVASAFASADKTSPVNVVPDPVAEAAPAPKSAPLPERPQALDLGEFAELPGRNAVWVEEQAAADPAPEPAARTASPPENALEKLRQRHPEELSLVEMVERFAGALHEHQAAERANLAKTGPTRDAALAEALKALNLFTERGFDKGPADVAAHADTSQLGQTERELRNALTKLQSLRPQSPGSARGAA